MNNEQIHALCIETIENYTTLIGRTISFIKSDYTEIAAFYDFHVFIKTDFSGAPLLYIAYDDDNLEGFYNLKLRSYENVDFKYVTGIIDEWIDCHYDILMQMWNNKTFITIPEWDEN